MKYLTMLKFFSTQMTQIIMIYADFSCLIINFICFINLRKS